MKKTFTNQQLIEAIKNNITIADVLRSINLKPQGNNYSTIKNIIKELGIDTSHILGIAHLKGKKKKTKPRIPTKELLVKGKIRASHKVKLRLINEGLLKELCYVCSITHWNGSKLSLQLDHIDGDNTNNELNNLRLLCPNCHSLTDTYCGKKNKKPRPFCVCGKEINKGSKLCKNCEDIARLGKKTKIQWPEMKDLIVMIKQSSYVVVAKKLGVSDNAVRKRIKNHPITLTDTQAPI